MPIYEYKCESCGDYFERCRPIEKRDDLAVHDECSGLGKRVGTMFNIGERVIQKDSSLK